MALQDQPLRHRHARGRSRPDRHQRHLQSELSKEGNQRCRQSRGEGFGERGDFLKATVQRAYNNSYVPLSSA